MRRKSACKFPVLTVAYVLNNFVEFRHIER